MLAHVAVAPVRTGDGSYIARQGEHVNQSKAAGDPAKLGILKAHLTRGQNRIVWALQLAREEAERATV